MGVFGVKGKQCHLALRNNLQLVTALSSETGIFTEPVSLFFGRMQPSSNIVLKRVSFRSEVYIIIDR